MAACYTGPFPFTNNGTESCIEVANTSFSGYIINNAVIAPGGITVTDSTITGGIADNGTTLLGGITVDSRSRITGVGSITAIGVSLSTFSGGISNAGIITDLGSGIGIGGVSTFAGGITNTGSITAGLNGITVFLPPTFTGGITNSGTITASGAGIGAFAISTFSGGITNTGTITGGSGIVAGFPGFSIGTYTGGIGNTGMIVAGSTGIAVEQISTFSGGISNSGTISAGAVGIHVGRTTAGVGVSTFMGGITNTGTISGGGTGILIQNTPAVSIFDSGTITGGATAIEFASGINTLTLGPGWAISGAVLGAGNDIFQLGGSGIGRFNLGLLGTQFTGFVTFNVVGASWITTGTNTNNWTIGSGASLQLGNGTTSGLITGAISDNGTLAFNEPGATTFANVISGTGGLTQMGPGTLTLSGSDSYSGGTKLLAGTLVVGNDSALGTGSLAIAAGTTLSFVGGSNFTVANQIAISGDPNFTPPLGTVQTLSGIISDGNSPGTLAMLGPGTLVLSGANSYTGGTTVSGGTLQLSGSGTLGSSAGQTTVSGGMLDLGGTTQTQNGGLTLTSGTVQDGTLLSSGIFALQSGTVSATLAGAGAVDKTSSGIVTLSGANSYTGATTIGAGTLALGNGGSIAKSSGVNLTGAGATFDISGGGNQTVKDLSGVVGSTVSVGTNLLNFGTGNSMTFAGSFTGSGGLVWQGTGTLSLTGNSNGFTGNTAITSGIVALGTDSSPNASLGGNVAVSGGTLKGFGVIGGNLANSAGTVQPGGTIGTLTVGGNYTQTLGGTLTIEVSPSAASQLKVGGAASLAGTLALVFDPGVYTPTPYKLLTASSVSGTFSTVTGTNPSGLAQAILYDPADVTLQLGSNTPTPIVVAPNNDTIYTAVTSAAVLTAQQANGIILDRLGQRQAGIADGQVAAATTGAVGSVAPAVPPSLQYAQAGNTAAIGDLASALPQVLAAEGAWFRGIGGFASLNGSSTAPGFTGETGGFLTGYDWPVTQNIYLGLAGGYLHSNIDEHSTSNGTQSSARFAFYGGAMLGPSLLTATVGYAHDWFDTNRGLAGIGTASESHGGNEATTAAQWGMPLTIQGLSGGAATLTPKAGFQFVHLSEDGFADNGASGFDLSAGGRSTDSFQPYLGVAAAQKFITDNGSEITPELRLGYAYEVLANSRLVTVTTVSGVDFPVTGVAPSRNQLTTGIGVSMVAGPNLSLYANYDATLPTGNTIAQTIQAGLRWRF